MRGSVMVQYYHIIDTRYLDILNDSSNHFLGPVIVELPTLLTQDVVLTSIKRHLNVMNVKIMDFETTLCAYWEESMT